MRKSKVSVKRDFGMFKDCREPNRGGGRGGTYSRTQYTFLKGGRGEWRVNRSPRRVAQERGF